MTAAVVVALGVSAYYLQIPHVASEAAASPSVVRVTASDPVRQAVRAEPVPGMPLRVVIPSLGVDAAVVPIKAAGRVLTPPSDPRKLGWWADGALPGARHGSALIAGHTVHTGGGAFDHLGDLAPGDRIRVGVSRGWIDYEVARVEVYSKGITARRAQQLFSQKTAGRLVLITCADWDGTQYLSNAVVTAVRTSR
ncbi:MAG: peptidase sortase [Marmoricola sp.]|nr:peptidase sortase [Marmoricola sp.]